MVDFDDMRNKADEENLDDKARDRASQEFKGRFDSDDNPREDTQQGQQDQFSDSDE
jgi:hypothetical protein